MLPLGCVGAPQNIVLFCCLQPFQMFTVPRTMSWNKKSLNPDHFHQKKSFSLLQASKCIYILCLCLYTIIGYLHFTLTFLACSTQYSPLFFLLSSIRLQIYLIAKKVQFQVGRDGMEWNYSISAIKNSCKRNMFLWLGASFKGQK